MSERFDVEQKFSEPRTLRRPEFPNVEIPSEIETKIFGDNLSVEKARKVLADLGFKQVGQGSRVVDERLSFPDKFKKNDAILSEEWFQKMSKRDKEVLVDMLAELGIGLIEMKTRMYSQEGLNVIAPESGEDFGKIYRDYSLRGRLEQALDSDQVVYSLMLKGPVTLDQGTKVRKEWQAAISQEGIMELGRYFARKGMLVDLHTEKNRIKFINKAGMVVDLDETSPVKKSFFSKNTGLVVMEAEGQTPEVVNDFTTEFLRKYGKNADTLQVAPLTTRELYKKIGLLPKERGGSGSVNFRFNDQKSRRVFN